MVIAEIICLVKYQDYSLDRAMGEFSVFIKKPW